MSRATGIEWTDATWNPIRGCSRVSEGCRNCYAEKVAYRFSGPGQPYAGLVRIGADGKRRAEWSGQIQFVEEHLPDPLQWKKPRRIFVNSMSDLFHENVTDAMLDRIFAVMALAPQHTFQVLTKRPERMLRWFDHYRVYSPGARELIFSYVRHLPGYSATDSKWWKLAANAFDRWPLPNVWLGVSVENRKAKERIDILRTVPAAIRFLSVEPLLEQLGNVDLAGIHWVICGGESGPGARPMHPDWPRAVRDQCVTAGVPFFFKQWGEWHPLTGPFALGKDVDRFKHEFAWRAGSRNDAEPPISCYRVGKKAAGRLLDGREWNQFPWAVIG